MNFVSLVTHGLSAISVFGEIVGVRLLVFATLLLFASLLAAATAWGLRYTFDWSPPDWAFSVLGLLGLAGINALLLAAVFTFTVLQARDSASFLPLRDYPFFIDGIVRWGENNLELSAQKPVESSQQRRAA